MSSSRPEILMNNFSVLGIGRIYPLWKANGSRFLARRLFRHELYSIVDAQAETKWYRENTPTQNDLAKQKIQSSVMNHLFLWFVLLTIQTSNI